ncbi:MAG: autotransporter outer membrane beta-barrel domain-containing protein [Rhodovibrionaceae bacterium]
MAFNPAPALAVCAGATTAGADSISCTGNGNNVTIDTLGGEDSVTVEAGARLGDGGDATISGGPDNDSFNVDAGAFLGFGAGDSATLNGNSGFDLFVIDNAGIGRQGAALIDGGAGSDEIRLLNRSRLGQAATGSGTLLGMGGEDLIVVDDSDVGRDGVGLIDGGDDNDTIRVRNGSNVGQGAGGSGTILGGAGEDLIAFDAAFLGRAGTALVQGGDDNDEIRVREGSIVGNDVGASGTLEGNGGDDQININTSILGRAGAGVALGGDGNDFINIFDGSVVGQLSTGSGTITGNAGEDTIVFNASVLGQEGAGIVRGGDDNDTINILNGSVLGQNSGGDAEVTGNSGEDTILIDASTLGQDGSAVVRGGSENDLITIANGSVIGQNATGSGTVEGNAGEDVITITDSFVGSLGMGLVDGGVDNDGITLAGTTHLNATSMVLGGGGDDSVTLFDTVTADAGATLDGEAGGMDNLILDGSGSGLFDGTITQQNFELLTKQGTGAWIWTTNAAFSEGASIDNGIFELNAILTADTFIAPLGTLSGTGEVIGDVDNDGTITPAGPGTIGTLTFTGNYDGGGVLMLDTVIGASGSPSDMLVITGTVSDVTTVQVTDFGGGTPQFTGDGPGNGILLVDVSAGSTDGDDFALQDGPIDVGFFTYELNLESDNNWYLQSTDLSPAGYDAGQALANMLSAAQDQVRSDIGIAHNRVQSLRLYEGGSAAQMAQAGDTQLASLLAGSDSGSGGMRHGHGVGVWIEGFGRDATLDPKGVEEFDQTTWGGQLGIDGKVAENLYLGLVGGYATSDIDFDGADGDIDSYTLGAYAAYIDGGFYIDGVIKGGWLDFDASSGGASKDYDGWLAAGAVKTGYGIALGEHVSIEPNAGLTWVHVDHDDFSFGGVSVDEEAEDSLQGRLGLRLSGDWETGQGGRFSPFVEAGVSHEFMGDNEIQFTTVNFESDMGGTSFDVGGGIAAVFDGGVAVSAGVTYTGGERIDAIQGTLGIGLRF